MKVCFFTLGCKVNQQETAAMMNIFKGNGWEVVPDAEFADAYIVNSCTVTLSGDKKSLQWIRRAKKRNPDSVVVLCGCMPQAFPEKAAAVSGADIVIGSKGKAEVYSLVCQFLQDKQRLVKIAPHMKDDKFEDISFGADSTHTRAFLKIEDGCNRHCAYCIIPTARGRVRSASVESIVAQASEMAQAGHREIVLTGVNISCYGQDIGCDVCDVIEAVADIPLVERIRLGSLELDLFTDQMLVRMSKVAKFCPYFHLSLQSGCDATLAAMHRLYDTGLYTQMMTRLRELFHRPTFTTDIIVGFPTESEQDFLQSVAFVQRCDFLKVHTFTFSPREGTAAFDMEQQIPDEIKHERNKIMSFKSDSTRQKIMDSFVGFVDTVLLEQRNKEGFFTGYTTRYIPVLIKDDGTLHSGDIVKVTLTETIGQRMSAVVTA
ncbi:MAG: tRNA (N(6)-L-threonylcarbamoyladenosine(37)-C(2))-methylthiotransferase MtaB [Oscillospiraceae bacterium]